MISAPASAPAVYAVIAPASTTSVPYSSLLTMGRATPVAE